MGKIYTNANDIENHIFDDYRKYDTELNSLFFDFKVDGMTQAELLELYASIQEQINGDSVLRLTDIVLEGKDTDDMYIWGKEAEEFIPTGEYLEIYKGNYKDFLESFNGREAETGFCRIMDVEEKDELIGGEKLCFVF